MKTFLGLSRSRNCLKGKGPHIFQCVVDHKRLFIILRHAGNSLPFCFRSSAEQFSFEHCEVMNLSVCK